MRHLSRHVQATLQDHVELYLRELAWIGPPEYTPFGALPVEYQRVRPSEDMLKQVEPNIVACSFGAQDDDLDEELGAGLVSQEHALFLDVYAENEGIVLALTEDIRDLLTGRASYAGRPPSRYVQVEDQTTNPPTPVVGYAMELVDVVRTPSARALPSVEWHVVTATVRLYLPGST